MYTETYYLLRINVRCDTKVIPGIERSFNQTFWASKTAKNGHGRWTMCEDKGRAERLPSMKRANAATKSKYIKQLIEDNVSVAIIEVEATYKEQRMWPLSPLEQLALVAV